MIFQISDININLKFFVGVTKANEKPWEQYFPQEQFSQHKQYIWSGPNTENVFEQ